MVGFVLARPGFFGKCPAVRVLGHQVGQRADALDLPVQKQDRVLLALHGITRELDARRSRVDDKNGALHATHSLVEVVWRRACASRTATAADASRVRGLSARLVNMIGNPGTEYDAGGIGIRHVGQLLGQHVARFQVGYEENVGLACDRRNDVLGPGSLLTDRVVERQGSVDKTAGDLAAVRHLAQRGGDPGSTGFLTVTVSTAERTATFGSLKPRTCARSMAF